MKIEHYNLIFIVLVYRNTEDLIDFFRYNKIQDSKIIVVNSFYDIESEKAFEKIAKDNEADYLSVPNKGYGYGNNRGIEYVIGRFTFDYLIISNADVTIEKFPRELLIKEGNPIIAPKILTLRNKNQNPASPFVPLTWIDKLQYETYKNNHKHLIKLFYAWSRLNKIVYYFISNFRKSIYAPHGAFIIIPFQQLNKLIPLFNEDMFLFFEENHIGHKARQNKVPIVYESRIVIRHKEDGSISLINHSHFNLMKDSFIKLHDYWKNIH